MKDETKSSLALERCVWPEHAAHAFRLNVSSVLMSAVEFPAYVYACDGFSSGSSDERKPCLSKERDDQCIRHIRAGDLAPCAKSIIMMENISHTE
jgi:hypothetical protein